MSDVPGRWRVVLRPVCWVRGQQVPLGDARVSDLQLSREQRQRLLEGNYG